MRRPQPKSGPALAGAMDLSGLKQSAQPDGGNPVPPGATEVVAANFKDAVLFRSNHVPVVVVLWSPGNDVSVQMVDALAQLAVSDEGTWSLTTVNVDVATQVAQAFGVVDEVPAVVAVAAGKPIASFQGSQAPDQLRLWVDSVLSALAGKLLGGGESEQPVQVDPGLAQARDQLEAGDFDAARDSYQALLDADPNHAEAKGALRQLTFVDRAASQRPDAPGIADAAPGDIEAAFAAADVQILNQDASAAFDRLIGLVRRTSGDERTSVRDRLVELFELFDPADPVVVDGRRNLANALY